MKANKSFITRLLLAALIIMLGGSQARAWDMGADADGKYDQYYDRPTHFPNWSQPNDWPNAQYYLVCARFGAKGPRVENYEVAVYDQNGKLRHCNRSMAKDDHLCVLTIKGTEGDQFHCQVIYGDFDNPTIVDVPETFGFGTNDIVGSKEEPFYLTVPGRTYLSETDTELPEDETNANVTVERTIKADEWGTICLPFAMTTEQVKAAFGEDVKLGDFTGCNVEYTDDTETTVQSINVKFSTVTAVEANHPYIIKVGKDITSFEVDGVDIHAEDASVDCDEQKMKVGSKWYYFYNSFIGNYENGFLVPEQKLFLSGGKFYYSMGKTPMMAFRAYFDFLTVLPEVENASSRIIMGFDGETPTGISSASDFRLQTSNCWYTLDGRKVNGMKPGMKGVYLSQGKKVIIK